MKAQSILYDHLYSHIQIKKQMYSCNKCGDKTQWILTIDVVKGDILLIIVCSKHKKQWLMIASI